MLPNTESGHFSAPFSTGKKTSVAASASAVLPGMGSSDTAIAQTHQPVPHLFLGTRSLSVPHSNHAQAL